MAYDPAAMMQKIRSFLSASARFPGGVTIGEPKGKPSDVAAAVLLGDGGTPEMTMTYAQGRQTVVVRLYANAELREPPEHVELLMGRMLYEVIEDFCGDFDWSDANVRNLLVTEVTWRLGYQTLETTMHRIADIMLPTLINDVAALT